MIKFAVPALTPIAGPRWCRGLRGCVGGVGGGVGGVWGRGGGGGGVGGVGGGVWGGGGVGGGVGGWGVVVGCPPPPTPNPTPTPTTPPPTPPPNPHVRSTMGRCSRWRSRPIVTVLDVRSRAQKALRAHHGKLACAGSVFLFFDKSRIPLGLCGV